jgi:hypothetical protein
LDDLRSAEEQQLARAKENLRKNFSGKNSLRDESYHNKTGLQREIEIYKRLDEDKFAKAKEDLDFEFERRFLQDQKDEVSWKLNKYHSEEHINNIINHLKTKNKILSDKLNDKVA